MAPHLCPCNVLASGRKSDHGRLVPQPRGLERGRCHVHRAGAKPDVAAGHSHSRKLSRGKVRQEAHACQHLEIAGTDDRGNREAGQRCRDCHAHCGYLRNPPQPAARSRFSRSRHFGKMRSRCDDQRSHPRGEAFGGNRTGPHRQSCDCARLETGVLAGLATGNGEHQSRQNVELKDVAEREVYAALDWLLAQQPRIETALAKKHLEGGALVLYDVSSSYLEGRCCELAQRGYSRDHRPDRPQIVDRKSSMACCAQPTARPLPSRCSRAIPPIPQHYPHKYKN